MCYKHLDIWRIRCSWFTFVIADALHCVTVSCRHKGHITRHGFTAKFDARLHLCHFTHFLERSCSNSSFQSDILFNWGLKTLLYITWQSWDWKKTEQIIYRLLKTLAAYTKIKPTVSAMFVILSLEAKVYCSVEKSPRNLKRLSIELHYSIKSNFIII